MLSSRSRPGFRVVTRFLSSQTPPSTWAYSDVPLTEAQRALASRRDADMRANYEAVLSVYPDHAQPQDGSAKVDKIEAYKKRLIYRSKQRGW